MDRRAFLKYSLSAAATTLLTKVATSGVPLATRDESSAEPTKTVVASGVWTAGAVKSTRYGDEAYRLGKSV